MTKLSKSQTDQAIHYNKARGYETTVIEKIQEIVKADVDGAFGPQTVNKIHTWQFEEQKDLGQRPRMPVQDGKMGPNSLGRMAGELIRDKDTAVVQTLLNELWKVLETGNRRWRTSKPEHPNQASTRSKALVADQRPFAVIVACIDSRVPPELLFDQGLGDLFTVRSAGQVLDQAVRGSIQYAVQKLLTPLVVVLGHENCGAVKAKSSVGTLTGDLQWLVEQIDPDDHDPGSTRAVEHNALKVRDELRSKLQELPERREGPAGQVIAGVYNLASREVSPA